MLESIELTNVSWLGGVRFSTAHRAKFFHNSASALPPGWPTEFNHLFQGGGKASSVSPEEFVAAVPGEYNFHVLTGQPRYHHGRENGVIGIRLPTGGDHITQHIQ